MSLTRRGLLGSLGALLAAPAIIRTPGLLMPVRPVVPLEPPALITAGYSGIMTSGRIYNELTAITRKAFVPSMFEKLYPSPMRAWMDEFEEDPE